MADIAIIGHGAVGRYLARGLPPGALAAGMSRPGREKVARDALGTLQIVNSAADLPKEVTCVVDCGGHAALKAHGAAVLASGRDLVTVSLGALADRALADDLAAAAEAGQSHLTLATGAIGALDALAAALAGGLSRVCYTGRKPPSGWLGSPAETTLDLRALTEPAVHFEGPARACALAYPKNANVAAAVALAGLGLDGTEARLIADPSIDANIHEIEAEGNFGRFHFEIAGKGLPDNPKSSALTAMSLVHALRARRQRVGFASLVQTPPPRAAATQLGAAASPRAD